MKRKSSSSKPKCFEHRRVPRKPCLPLALEICHSALGQRLQENLRGRHQTAAPARRLLLRTWQREPHVAETVARGRSGRAARLFLRWRLLLLVLRSERQQSSPRALQKRSFKRGKCLQRARGKGWGGGGVTFTPSSSSGPWAWGAPSPSWMPCGAACPADQRTLCQPLRFVACALLVLNEKRSLTGSLTARRPPFSRSRTNFMTSFSPDRPSRAKRSVTSFSTRSESTCLAFHFWTGLKVSSRSGGAPVRLGRNPVVPRVLASSAICATSGSFFTCSGGPQRAQF